MMRIFTKRLKNVPRLIHWMALSTSYVVMCCSTNRRKTSSSWPSKRLVRPISSLSMALTLFTWSPVIRGAENKRARTEKSVFRAKIRRIKITVIIKLRETAGKSTKTRCTCLARLDPARSGAIAANQQVAQRLTVETEFTFFPLFFKHTDRVTAVFQVKSYRRFKLKISPFR